MLTTELVAFTFERRKGEARFDDDAMAILDGFRPHLARAGLMAARLRMSQASAAVSALEAIGLPSAAITNSGRVLVANPLFETAAPVFLPLARGELGIADEEANKLFRRAVAASRENHEPDVRSNPLVAKEGRPPMVIHVLPLRRSASDIFFPGRDSS